uniref:Translocon-associated protein subunit beta n=1 Tax=Panagrellus redivivus TaxID=6233 RepID=A0A7E4UQN0_PANRE
MKFVLLSALLCVVFAEETELDSKPALNSARILASKHSLSQYAVESLDYVIQYDLYNIGDQPARQVVLDDRNSFPTQSFEVVKGLLQVKWDRIPAGENVTHSVVVRPRNYGVFNYTAAAVTYYPSESAKDVRFVYSTSPGEGYIYRLKDYERRFSSKIGTWIGFLILVVPTTLIPYILWSKSSALYPASAGGKKQK